MVKCSAAGADSVCPDAIFVTVSAPMASPHPNIAGWTRDHDTGAYSTEVDGWTLVVRWTPNTRERRGFFAWEAEKDGAKETGERHYEEMEVAMAAAEAFARGPSVAPASDTSSAA